MVERLLEISRSSAESTRLSLEKIPLGSFVETIWRQWKEEAEARGIAFQTQGDSQINTEPVLFQRIVTNLMENAVHYSDPNSVISVDIAPDRMTISNAASNFQLQDVDRVFDPFWRSDTGRSSVGTHAGLGLSLSRRLAEILGLDIRADFADGRFSVELGVDSRVGPSVDSGRDSDSKEPPPTPEAEDTNREDKAP